LSACGGDGSPAPPLTPPPPPPPPVGPDWSSLSGSLQGRLLRPGDASFAGAAPVFNAVYDATVPQAIVRCASAGDIALALSFARQNSLPVVARSGGHGYTGDSTTTGIVVDVGAMDAIAVNADGTATIGAGARLVDVYDQLSTAGVCIPSGSCPTIGIAGITQGGGIGALDRAWGLTCDNLLSADVVLADGTIVDVSETSHADLFWALRGGGGGNFCIVAQMTFRTFPTSDLTTFAAEFAWADSARVFAAWQAWPRTMPDALWSGMVLATTASGGAVPYLQVSGTFIGSDADFAPIWSQFLAGAGATPSFHSTQTQSFRDAMLASCNGLSVAQCHLPVDDGQVQRGSFVAASDFFNAAMPPEGSQAMLDKVAAVQAGGGQMIVIMDLMGGAIARVAPDATAFVHRNALFSAQYYISGPVGMSPQQVSDARAAVTAMRAAMAAWSSGECYQNYLDPGLADWQSAYYGANYARLVQVKAAYDPSQVFRPAQGIPPQ
jgi:FAD/FMN-containing dehydrogenase